MFSFKPIFTHISLKMTTGVILDLIFLNGFLNLGFSLSAGMLPTSNL